MTQNHQQAPDKQTAPRQHPDSSLTSRPRQRRFTPARSSPAEEPSRTLASSHPALVPIPTARTAAILKTRARALARVTEQHSTEETGLSVVEFLVGSARYALPASYVREVYRFKELTPLPSTPPSIAGIINVRGLMLAVIDIRPLLALPPVAQAKQETVIILHTPDKELGVLTQGMLGVHTIPLSQLHPAPQTISRAPLEYVRGVTNTQLIIIDAEKLLADPPSTSLEPRRTTRPIRGKEMDTDIGKELRGTSLPSAPAAGQAS